MLCKILSCYTMGPLPQTATTPPFVPPQLFVWLYSAFEKGSSLEHWGFKGLGIFLLERGWWVWFLSRWFGTPGWVCGRTSERSICWPGEGKRAVRWGQGKRKTCHRWKLPEQPQPQHAVSHTEIQLQALCSPWSSMQPFHCSGEPSPYKTFYTGKSTPEFNSHLH